MTAEDRLENLKNLLKATFPAAQVKHGWPKSFPANGMLITYTLGVKNNRYAIGNQRVGAFQTINLNIWTSTELDAVGASETLEQAMDKTEYQIVTTNTVHETGIKLEWRKALILQVFEKL
jgi:hypothetical protein